MQGKAGLQWASMGSGLSFQLPAGVVVMQAEKIVSAIVNLWNHSQFSRRRGRDCEVKYHYQHAELPLSLEGLLHFAARSPNEEPEVYGGP